ncbi:MAG: hypothetical protein IH984_06160 [Planctomycetes bacterium]|nr:hypothetical protein [Planctomycetota bacterium]
MRICKQTCLEKEQCQSAANKTQIVVADSVMLSAGKQLRSRLNGNEDNETVKDIFCQMQSFLQDHHLEGKQVPTAKIPPLIRNDNGITDLWELEMPFGLAACYSYIDGKIVIVDVV